MPKVKQNKSDRRQQILEVLTRMLEENIGGRITTANLAKEVGVTEAALYRHFPSKAKMFEGLIEFIEEAVFSRVNRINQEEGARAIEKLQKILTLVLAFAEKNAGLCRIIMGDALQGENPKVRQRARQFFERLETEIKQVIRQAEVNEKLKLRSTAALGANLLIVNLEGRIHQYVRTEFSVKPTAGWSAHWPLLAAGTFQ